MKISLVVLNYNDSSTTINLLNKVKHYRIIDNLIVVDNCSTDQSFQILNSYAKSVEESITVIKTDKNGGYAYGNNYGCYYALNNCNSEYLVVANPDIYFEENTLRKIINVYKDKTDAAIVSCLMNCTSDINLPSAWKLPRYCDCILENLLILRKIVGNRTRYEESKLKGLINNVDVIAGSFFVIPGNVFDMIKGFDNSTFLYYEENILAYKLKKMGYSNYLVGNVYYDHLHSVSINKAFSTIKKRLDLSFESRRIYVVKYLKVSLIKKKIFEITYYMGRLNYLAVKEIIDKISVFWRK